MNKVTFNCEVITPAFIAGAKNSLPEIRPPSIKGLLRYWWRSMHGELALDVLKEKESLIFGSVNTGRSGVVLYVNGQPKNRDIGANLWDEIHHKDMGRYRKPTEYHGITYLLYSVLTINQRPYVKPGFSFSLKLTAKDEKMLKEAVNALWCLSFLGSIGNRSRRGAGCLRVTTEHPRYKEMFDATKVVDKVKLKNFLASYIDSFNLKPGTADFSVLKGSNIYIMEPSNNWKDALETIGNPFREFRYKVKNRVCETPNFGFPVRHRDGAVFGAGPQKISKNRGGNVKGFLDRRSSPLVIKVLKTQENCFFPMIVWLKGELIPKSHRIMDKQGQNTAQQSTNLIVQFLNFLKNKLVMQI